MAPLKHRHDPVQDANGEPITIGTLIRFEAYEATEHYPAQPETVGIVTGVSDWDGDVDEDGRTIGYPPAIVVRYDDGSDERFLTYRSHHDEEDSADDLEVAFHGPLQRGQATLSYDD